MAYNRVINFNAGPSTLPLSVVEETSHAILNFQQTGIGIAEFPYRAKEFVDHMKALELQIRTQLDVPFTHSILFTQGGATGQFSAVVFNMLARHFLLYPDAKERKLGYVVTGNFSKKAMEEGKRLCGNGPRGAGGTVEVVVDSRRTSKDGQSFDNLPPHAEWAMPSTADDVPPAMIYYCDNETANGVQFSDDPASPAAFPIHLLAGKGGNAAGQLLPLVGDYSSSFMSRPIPRLADHAIIYAGAQKNIGPAGLTVIIVREDCLVDSESANLLGAAPIPITMSYKAFADNDNLYHTPPVVCLYMSGLVLERMNKLGGMKYFRALNKRKQEKVYRAVDEGEKLGRFKAGVQKGSRSWMNVVFEIVGEGAEKRFLEGAERNGMKNLKGHRSVGGIRVSLYNALTEEEVDKLVEYIEGFLREEQ